MGAVASAMPSMKPTSSADAPSTPIMYIGRSAWIISDEMSMNIETKPSAQTPVGIWRNPAAIDPGFAMPIAQLITAPPRDMLSIY